MAHSKGEWRVGHVLWEENGEGLPGVRFVEVVGPEFMIARVQVDEDDSEQVSNLRLITAAPDMLDVLRLVANSTSSGLRLCNCDGMADGFKCEDCLIWAAIDKAEGRVT